MGSNRSGCRDARFRGYAPGIQPGGFQSSIAASLLFAPKATGLIGINRVS